MPAAWDANVAKTLVLSAHACVSQAGEPACRYMRHGQPSPGRGDDPVLAPARAVTKRPFIAEREQTNADAGRAGSARQTA